MNDASPALEIGFLIDHADSYQGLIELQQVMDSVEGQIVADAVSIERATRGMVKTDAATANMRTFGAAATREAQATAREIARVEKAGEALSRQLGRDSAAFGRTREEMRAMKVEAAAVAAEQQGLTELAGRLRSQYEALVAQQTAAAAASAREAQALREAAQAHLMFEAAAKRGAQAMRDQETAEAGAVREAQQLAAAAERLRGSIDPSYAAQQRFNREMEQAQTLISRGAISLDDYAAKLRMERAALDASNAAHARGAVSAGAHSQAMMGASYQVQDFITQVSMGANPINAFAVQGAQLAGQFANVEGKAGAVARFFMGPWGLAITGAVMLAGMLTKGLFENASAMQTAELAADSFGSAQNVLGQMFDLTTGKIKSQNEMLRLNIQLTSIQLRADAIKSEKEAQAALKASGQLSWGAWFSGGAGGHRAGNIHQQYNTTARAQLRGVMRGTTDAAQVAKWAETADFGSLNISREEYMNALASVVEVRRNRDLAGRIDKSLEDGQLDAAFINAAKPKKPEKPKIDRHAEGLQRDADATEAQIKNLYALAEAYDKSGAAALVAEARVKAESDAIKKRGDVEAIVSRQVQVAIAQRVADAAKNSASMRDQVRIQDEVNARVAAGNVPAERAAQLVQDRLADLPLLQAAEAAQQRGLKVEADAALKALAEQQAVREDMRKAEEKARFNSAMASGSDQLAMMREELRLAGATNEERARALALIKATQEARQFTDAADRQAWIDQQMAIHDTSAAIERQADAVRRAREEFEYLVDTAQAAGDAIASAFGNVGSAVADVIGVLGDYQKRQKDIDDRLSKEQITKARALRESTDLQLQSFAALAGAAKGFFKEGSAGYKTMAAAEKAFALVQLANTAVNVAAGAAKMFATLGPWAFPAVAAMIGVMASLGFASGGNGNGPDPTNEGTGTVLGDSAAKSESITRAINQLREVDTLMLGYSRQMAGSLRTIEDNIAGFASLLVRNADGLNASTGVTEGFKSNAGTTLAGIGMILGGPIGAGIGALLTKIPIVGSILKGLFGTKTTVIGSGLYGGAQSLESILAGGFDAQVYSDIKKKKKFFGISAGTKYSTQYGAADPMLENQFTLILKSFNDAIIAAAGPLGAATSDIQQRLNSFVLNIGKIDLQGLTGEQIEEKLTAVFGAAADSMAQAAFPGIDRFQKVGEGLFETLVRVSSTVEAVTASFDMLGRNTVGMSIDVKMALADQFDSVSALTDAVGNYFAAYYTKEEQAAARMGQMTKVFESLGMAMPGSLAAFRSLVEAQDLNTAAGREAYALLLQLAPAFADLQAAMAGAKSAADIASERQDLERQLLELRGDTAALRALQLAKLDASNRALQQEIWAMQDAQAAAKAADELRKAWQGVSDSIMEEVRRIRGLTAEGQAGSYAALLSRFNAATTAARGGDIDAAKTLPQLSQALLAAAQDQARTRAELDRIRAQIAASLELTNGLIAPPASNTSLLDAAAASQPGSGASATSDAASTADSVDELREETKRLRADLTAALATIAANTAKTARKLEDVTAQSGGDAISTVPAA